jgi:hypothetical protein
LTVGDGWHPIAVGTVNPGVYWCVFDTTWLLAAAVDLNDKQQGDLAVQSLDYAFCDATVKKKVQDRIRLYNSVRRRQRQCSLSPTCVCG